MYAMHTYEDGPFDGDASVSADFNTILGLAQPAHDHFEAGRRMLDAMADDISLDADEFDLEGLY